MAHTPRFTAKAPEPRDVPRRFRAQRCVTVKACDIELRELSARRRRTTHPETVAGLDADIDEVLEIRTRLAFDEAAALAVRIAREDR